MFRLSVRWVFAVSAGLLTSLAFGEGAPPSGASVDPKADEILRRMSKFLAGTKAFSLEAHDMVDEVLDSGQKLQFSHVRKVTVRRPDRVWVDHSGDIDNKQGWYDGKTVTMLDKKQKVYSVIAVPNNIDEMLDFLVDRFGDVTPLADLLLSDPYKSAMSNVRLGGYIGLHHVQGVKCHHLAFRQDGIDWQIWIEDGDRPLPRKLVITYKELPGQPQYVVILGKWDLSPKLPDGLFTFKPPAGAKKVERKPIRARPAAGRMPGDRPSQEGNGGK